MTFGLIFLSSSFLTYYSHLSLNPYLTTLLHSAARPRPALCDPVAAAHQALPSVTVSCSLGKFMSIESMMPSRPSDHLVLAVL